jgi:hypothetical protein
MYVCSHVANNDSPDGYSTIDDNMASAVCATMCMKIKLGDLWSRTIDSWVMI